MTWTLQTAQPVQSLNTLLSWKANKQWWRYAKERELWRRMFGMWALAERIPHATGRRRLTIVRVFAGRQRAFDRDNLSGGIKPLMDALKPRHGPGGLLTDDDDAGVDLIVSQEKGETAGTRITLEDITTEAA
jgi:hypothetical protein